MSKFNVLMLLSLYPHVIANRLNLKYIRCAVMAEWLTHLTKDIGGTWFESFRIPVINFLPLDVNIYLGVFHPCNGKRFEDKRTTRENNKEFTALLSSLS